MLTSLAITGMSYRVIGTPHFSALANFKSLKTFKLPPTLDLTASMLLDISEVSTLEFLSARVNLRHGDENMLRGRFLSLTRLKLMGSASGLASFLQATSPPLLTALSLRFTSNSERSTLLAFIASTVAAVPNTLKRLSLAWDSAHNQPPLEALMDVIEPALALRSLTKFVARVPTVHSVDDNDIERMVTAWPDLSKLRIVRSIPSRGPVDDGHLTWRVFLHHAERCPDLTCIELPDVSFDNVPDEAFVPPITGHGLQELEFWSRDRDTQTCLRMAILLDKLFPHLELPDFDHVSWAEGWIMVQHFLLAMQNGRAHEKVFERMELEKTVMAEVGPGHEHGAVEVVSDARQVACRWE